MNRCCICDKSLTGTSWFCNQCAKEYELTEKKYDQWPEWVKYLISCERKERYKNKIDNRHNVVNYGVFMDDIIQEVIQ